MGRQELALPARGTAKRLAWQRSREGGRREEKMGSGRWQATRFRKILWGVSFT